MRLPDLRPREMPNRTPTDLRAALLWYIRHDLEHSADPRTSMRFAAIADALSYSTEYTSATWIEALSQVLPPEDMDYYTNLDEQYWTSLTKIHEAMGWTEPHVTEDE